MKASIKSGLILLCALIFLSMLTEVRTQAADYKFNMSYIFFGKSYTGLVDKTQNSLNEVAPNYFSLNKNGSLALTSAISASFISDMHKRGISVVPYLTNDWSRSVGRAAMKNRQALAQALADAVITYGLDGVNIDIENLTSSDRDDFVEFVQLLRAALPEGKSIAVSVAANPWGISTGWQGSYDYARLAEYSDYLMIMAYDEHYCGGPAGPVSSLSFVEKSIKYAVSVIPKEKVVLGLPFYGRIWSNTGGYPNGTGITNAKIAQLVNSYGGCVSVDPASRSTKAVFTISQDAKKPVVGGQALAAGTYTIWYEGEQSIKEKLSLVTKYDIKGTGSWALGEESDSTWDYYKLWLNSCTFGDIEKSWAKDNILEAYLDGWADGISDTRFSPDAPLTRAQAVTMIVKRLGIELVSDPALQFDDCVGSWAEPYIETARQYHIADGIGNNLFDPDRTVTREELAVMLKNATSYQVKTDVSDGNNAFTDVSQTSNPESYNAIETLRQNGILFGYTDGSFRPEKIATRAEATVMISRLTPGTAETAVFTGDGGLF
ncbi:glycosyl hydrolase family 18 protein [Oscillospiraceae bacterium WX1]